MSYTSLARRAALATLLLTGSLFAASKGPKEAEMVVTGWLRANPRPLDTVLNDRLTGIETIRAESGRAIGYVVQLRPAGFVVVPADDLIEPIIAFAGDGSCDRSPGNPLWALIYNDLQGRIAAVRAEVGLLAKPYPKAQTGTQQKWALLRSLGELANDQFGLMALGSVSDVRVAPLVRTRWGQRWIASGQGSSPRACYNYYTPQILPGGALSWDHGDLYHGSADNYFAGCVATAMAQLMRYYQFPRAAPIQPDPDDPNSVVRVGRFDTDDTFVPLVPDVYRTLLGGDGLGGNYVWERMPAEPDSNTTTGQAEAIGALCHDAGVAARMMYTAEESRTSLYYAKQALMSNFRYESAVFYGTGEGNIGPALIGMINPNLDAARPVIVGITGPNIGHAVVVDGYGYDSATLYHHLNMGWEGTDDGWYNLPIIECQEEGYVFNTLVDCLYNVFDTGRGEIISGRVLAEDGRPADGAAVYRSTTGADPCEVFTDSKGIYFFDNLESDTTYTIWASVQGSEFPARQVTTGNSFDHAPSSGNRWAVDFPQTLRVLYVDRRALAGADDGSSWSNAFVDLQDALEAAANSPQRQTEIWVARGTYKPDRSTGNRELSFRLLNGVALYGGFAGGESAREQRDPAANETILTGDLRGNDGDNFTNDGENSHHVVDARGADVTATIDGFTITAGNADGDESNVQGAGILLFYSKLIISNCKISRNRAARNGGGIYSQDSNPRLANCTFSDNAAAFGAAMVNYDGGAAMSNCEFSGNVASETGGGLYNHNSSPTVTFCIFTGNSANGGAGMSCQNSSNAAVSNCEFVGNRAIDGGGGAMYIETSDPSVEACRFRENSGRYGGGMACMAGGDTSVSSCQFTANIADESGGAIYNQSSNLSLTYCTVSNNSAQRGGGLLNFGGSVSLSSCILTGNNAILYGGAVFNETGNSAMSNCTFAANAADAGGGAFNGFDSAPIFTNCNLISNEARMLGGGGGILNYENSVAALSNCIIWSNINGQLAGSGGGDSKVTYSNVEGGFAGEGNMNSEPFFADPDKGDYHLKSQAGRWDPTTQMWATDNVTSPCIDAGDPSTPLGSEPWPNGGIINIGAYGGTAEASKTAGN